MKSKIVHVTLGAAIAILLSLLPVYPLWMEGREFAQTGESLYHELQFVALHEYYAYARYARNAWSEATTVVYVLLAMVNLLVLLFLPWLAVSALRKWTTR